MNVAPKPNRPPIWVICLVGAVVFFGIISSFSSKPTAQVSQSTPVPAVSLDEQIRQVAKSSVDQASGIDELTYEGVTVSAYDASASSIPAPSNALDVSVRYHVDPLGHDMNAAEYTATLFQKIFPLDSAIWHVSVEFDGPGHDRYGKELEMPYMSYSISRGTFSKVAWGTFESSGLCNFLRSEGASANESGNGVSLDDMCILTPSIKTLADDLSEQ
jgi:hypothetical protein